MEVISLFLCWPCTVAEHVCMCMCVNTAYLCVVYIWLYLYIPVHNVYLGSGVWLHPPLSSFNLHLLIYTFVISSPLLSFIYSLFPSLLLFPSSYLLHLSILYLIPPLFHAVVTFTSHAIHLSRQANCAETQWDEGIGGEGGGCNWREEKMERKTTAFEAVQSWGKENRETTVCLQLLQGDKSKAEAVFFYFGVCESQ